MRFLLKGATIEQHSVLKDVLCCSIFKHQIEEG